MYYLCPADVAFDVGVPINTVNCIALLCYKGCLIAESNIIFTYWITEFLEIIHALHNDSSIHETVLDY